MAPELGANGTGSFDRIEDEVGLEMQEELDVVRTAAIDLADPRLLEEGARMDRSIQLPRDAALLVVALADLWTSVPADRPALQSRVAAASATFDASAGRVADVVDFDALAGAGDPSTLSMRLRPPAQMQALIDEVQAGALTGAERAPSSPPSAGLALLSGVDWLIGIDELSMRAADHAEIAAGDVADEARDEARWAAALAVVGVLGSIVAASWFGRSILRPVRRLTDQAERIGSGHLDVTPRAQGPPEIVLASDAMNDVVENLVLLERKSSALARADFEDPSLRAPLPGRLGASLQLSMAVLSASIEEREVLRSRLEYKASHDSLTGVGNRAALDAALERMQVDGSGTVAVTFVDLDDFKIVNDRHGHALGDEVLKVIADRLVAEAPAPSFVARLGGDEFVIATPDVVDAVEPMETARRVVAAVSAPIVVQGRTVLVHASAGIALSGGASTTATPAALLQMADVAVYAAKSNPDDRVAVFDDELDRQLGLHLDVEAGLCAALDGDRGELRLVYQPIVRAEDLGVHHLEALLRWSSPPSGAEGPDVFIPIAERSDLIVDVDRWVVETAIAQVASWAALPSPLLLPVSVNVSGRSLVDRSFVEAVTDALDRAGARADLLTIEITETALVADLDLAAAQLDKIRDLGVQVAIDDFGTGYTSVAHLRTLPVDELKIDRVFVADLPEQENRVLVELITELAHHLDVPVVAEGVETVDQVEELRAIGCDRLQGYYFSRPLEGDAVPGWVGGWVGGSERP